MNPEQDLPFSFQKCTINRCLCDVHVILAVGDEELGKNRPVSPCWESILAVRGQGDNSEQQFCFQQ
jgi:hypothetical protein